MIELDGSHEEGGGQIVRIALAFSAVTGKPFRITNIRKGRDKPGLKHQHLAAVEALQSWTGAKATGAHLSSTELEFYPGTLRPKTVTVDIGTAGSLTLLLQSLLIPALFSGGRVRFRLKGGTDVAFSPPADYFANVLVPHLRKFVEKIDVKIIRRGYVPQGGGEMDVVVSSKLSALEQVRELVAPFTLERQHRLAYVRGVSHASDLLAKAEVAQRQAAAAKRALSSLNTHVDIRAEYSTSYSAGSGVTLFAVYAENDEVSYANPVILGASALGAKALPSEEVGKRAAQALLEQMHSGAAADAHLADQLVPLLALAGGAIRTSSVTPHARAAMHVAEAFLGKRFSVEDNVIRSD